MVKLLKILAVFVILVVLALAFLFFRLDPNVFKSRIQAEAQKQGIHLTMAGDLHWQFWPSVGFEINDISVASVHTPSQVVARLKSASLLVAVRPLLRRELEVHHLLIEGAKVNLLTAKNGKNNWDLLPEGYNGGTTANLPNAEPAGGNAAPKVIQPPSLSVGKISITDSTVSFLDEQTQQKTVLGLNALHITNVNLKGTPIAITGAWGLALYEGANKTFTLVGKTDIKLQLDPQLNALTAEAALNMTVGDQVTESVSGQLSLSVKNLQDNPIYQGQWDMDPINLKQLLASLGQEAPITHNEKALTHFSIKTSFNGTDSAITLSPLAIVLDESTLTGVLAVTNFERGVLNVKLAGDTINVDDYMAPMPEGDAANTPAATAANTPASAVADATPLIPLDVIKILDLDVQLDWAHAIVSNLKLDNMQLALKAKNGVVSLNELSFDAYKGRFLATGTLTVKNKTAQIDFTANMNNMELAPLLHDLELDEDAQLSGAINLELKGNTRGITQSVLMDQLVANATFNGAKVRFSPLNVEQRFCQLVDLLNESDEDEQAETVTEIIWPEYTAMRELDGLINIKNQIVTIESFSAGVAHLTLTTLGEINLAEETYNMYLPFALAEKSTSDTGCTVKSNYWLDRSLSLLRCHGSLANLDPLKDCGFDSKALRSLTKDYAAFRVKKELTKKFSGKTDEDGNPTLESQAVDLLFDFFNKKKKDKK